VTIRFSRTIQLHEITQEEIHTFLVTCFRNENEEEIGAANQPRDLHSLHDPSSLHEIHSIKVMILRKTDMYSLLEASIFRSSVGKTATYIFHNFVEKVHD
jgi:hypothetical protein